MKRLLTLFLALLSALSLATVAYADAIASPIDVAADLLMDNLAIVLVAAVVIITAILLWRMRKKK